MIYRKQLCKNNNNIGSQVFKVFFLSDRFINLGPFLVISICKFLFHLAFEENKFLTTFNIKIVNILEHVTLYMSLLVRVTHSSMLNILLLKMVGKKIPSNGAYKKGL